MVSISLNSLCLCASAPLWFNCLMQNSPHAPTVFQTPPYLMAYRRYFGVGKTFHRLRVVEQDQHPVRVGEVALILLDPRPRHRPAQLGDERRADELRQVHVGGIREVGLERVGIAPADRRAGMDDVSECAAGVAKSPIRCGRPCPRLLAGVGNADIIVASDDATFGLPEVDRGALGAATHLSRLVPQHRMRAMMYTSATATAAELHAYGSVLQVVPRAELRDAAFAVAGGIAAKDPTVIRAAKESLNGIDPWDVRRSYRFEQGFTFELNLSGVADKVREEFGR